MVCLPSSLRRVIRALSAAASVLAAALTLSGCASGAQPAASTSSATPSAAVQAATEQQVASVLAEYGDDFREVTKGASNCRILWTVGAETFADKANAMTCYVTAGTANLQASIVLKKWGELTIPDSMQDLVTQTSTPLQDLADIDFGSTCGTGDVPKDTKKCDLLLGRQYGDLQALDSQLDAWKPYGV